MPARSHLGNQPQPANYPRQFSIPWCKRLHLRKISTSNHQLFELSTVEPLNKPGPTRISGRQDWQCPVEGPFKCFLYASLDWF